MTEQAQQALMLAASKMKARAIDPDVFKATIIEEIDASDSEAVEKAAKKAVEQHPTCSRSKKAGVS